MLEHKGDLRATVSVNLRTLVPFRTLPNAECTLTTVDGTGETASHKVHADDGGVVRLHVRPSSAFNQNLKLTAFCATADKSESISIELRANPCPTTDMPHPPPDVPDRIFDHSDKWRAPLTKDPARMHPEELLLLGYPPSPDPIRAPRAYASWLRMASKPLMFIPPREILRPDLHPLKYPPSASPTGERFGANSFSNWCGFALKGPPNTFAGIVGSWPVPNVAPSGDPYGATALWIGIDGYGSSDLVQAGTDSEAWYLPVFGGGWSFENYWPWHEWFPGPSFQIANLPILPGDLMYAQVWVAGGVAHYFMGNETRGYYTWTTDAQPAQAQFVGNSAEWILERPQVNGGTVPLDFFAFASMTDAWAFGPNFQGYFSTSNTDFDSITMFNPADGHLLVVPIRNQASSFVYMQLGYS